MVDPGHGEDSIDVHKLPGALEFPLHCKMLAKTGRYDAIIIAALIVDGGIYRHNFVAHAVLQGIMNVQIETEVPILSAALTPLQPHEHEANHRFFYDHLVKKGREAADAATEATKNLRAI